MEEENQQTTQNTEQNNSTNSDRPHVRIFGADVDSGSNANKDSSSKEDWRAKKAQWRAERQAERDQWRMQRQQNGQAWGSNHHGEGYFAGLILLLAGIVALSYTLGFISQSFWYAIEPFWPILLILWGASIVLGRHWFSRFILFIFTLAFFVIVIFYGLVKTNSPYVSGVSPNVRSAIMNNYQQQ